MLLGSRIALGVYVPAISIKKQLEAMGHSADILCLEDLYSDREAVIEETKRSFHQDFRLAKMSYRMPTRNTSAVDAGLADKLLGRLVDDMYDTVIIFSGFWMKIINELLESCDHYKDRIYALHMDAGQSLSWKGVDRSCVKDVWLYSLEHGKVQSLLERPVVVSPESKRILVHGGGWGIGDYASRIKQLNELGYALDIVIYYPDEIDTDDEINTYYLLDPEWKPDEKRSEYPRLLIYKEGEFVPFGDNTGDINPLRVLMNRDVAVLSKPGGGTLSDSLITATPLILGEELARYEADNKKLWLDLGFAVDLGELLNVEHSGDDEPKTEELLEECRQNLLSAQTGLPHILDLII